MFRVLFVCTGNTCRSPIAEAILKGKQLENLEVRSAGTSAITGSEISLNSQLVIMDNNLEGPKHSTLLTKHEINWATHILTMTASHKHYITNNFPEALGKTYTINEFVDETGDIVDPFGGPIDVYKQTYYELDDKITKMIKRTNFSMGD